MPPRVNFYAASRSLTVRTRPIVPPRNSAFIKIAPRRYYADEKQPPAKGPNQDVLGHVSEEAADMGDVTGETKPDLNQGTPVQEVSSPMICICLS